MRVFSTLMSWSNENKGCMKVDKREFNFSLKKRVTKELIKMENDVDAV